jgi:A/G-specific adenine glycosylase
LAPKQNPKLTMTLTSDPFSTQILEWYHIHGRDFFWKRNPIPYHTWVCEVMSQQTSISVVASRLAQFLDALPTVKDLAQCSEAQLRSLWTGLGYYARARNLKKAAQLIISKDPFQMPSSYEDWLSLPGIGPYTAAMLCSIHANEPKVSIDGNVIRFLSRFLDLRDLTWQKLGHEKILHFAQSKISKERPGDFNQALIDIGSQICTKSNPLCWDCPVRNECKAHQLKSIPMSPGLKPKPEKIQKTIFCLVVYRNGFIQLQQRTKGLLKKTRGFPLLDLDNKAIHEKLVANSAGFFQHSITKFKLTIHIVHLTEATLRKILPSHHEEVLQNSEYILAAQIPSELGTSLDIKALNVIQKKVFLD